MPPAMAISVEVAEPAVGMGAGLIGGGLQKVAWEVSMPLGFITTSVMAIGGIVGSFMLEGIGAAALRGIGISGATVAGWQMTDTFMLPAVHSQSRNSQSRQLTEEQRQAALAAARDRRSLTAGRQTPAGAGQREQAAAVLEF